MNYKINHGLYETIVLDTTYSIDEQIESGLKHPCYAWRHHEQGTLVPELKSRYEESHRGIISCLLATIGLTIAFILHCLCYISEDNSLILVIKSFIFVLLILGFNYVLAYFLIKSSCDLRYFVFKGDKVIFQSKVFGRRIYRAKDLKFHLIKIRQYNHRLYLEVELPDLSIPADDRLIILEAAASKKTMDAVLAVFFPLLRGDNVPYVNATPRRIQPIPVGDYVSVGRHIDNLETHLHIWFLSYKVNQILFWIMHGSRDELMEKELKRSEFGGSLL